MEQGDFWDNLFRTFLPKYPSPESVGGEGMLSDVDMADLGKAETRVYELMKDGRLYTDEQIIKAVGIKSGLRRMRQLRKLAGVEIEKVPCGKRLFKYRMIQK